MKSKHIRSLQRTQPGAISGFIRMHYAVITYVREISCYKLTVTLGEVQDLQQQGGMWRTQVQLQAALEKRSCLIKNITAVNNDIPTNGIQLCPAHGVHTLTHKPEKHMLLGKAHGDGEVLV